MPVKGYKPKIGEQNFVSLSGHEPILITTTGFRYHSHLKEDVMEFTRLDGSTSWATFMDQEFYTEIPVDTPYIYFVVASYDTGYDYTSSFDERWFFKAEQAFDHISALQRGDVSAGYTSDHSGYDYTVEIRQVV